MPVSTVSDPLSITFIQHTVFTAILHIWRPSISSQPMHTQCCYDRVGPIIISNYEMYCQWYNDNNNGTNAYGILHHTVQRIF